MSQMHIDDTFGAAFVGLIVGAILYGITILQTYIYYRRYPKDELMIKCMVFLLWFLDTAHLVLCAITMYWYLVTNFSNANALQKPFWSMNLQTDCNGLIGLIVESFFARRVWILSGNWLITGVIVFLAFVHFGLGILFTVESFILELSQFSKLIWVTSIGLGSAAAADILIAISLCWSLSKNRTGFHHTDSLITTLMIYSLNSGLLTSIIATVVVVTFATMPLNFIWLSFFWILGKCYVNSLLAALNSRNSLRERVAVQDANFYQLSPFQVTLASTHNHETSPSTAHSNAPSLVVNIEKATVTKTDFLESPGSSASTDGDGSTLVSHYPLGPT